MVSPCGAEADVVKVVVGLVGGPLRGGLAQRERVELEALAAARSQVQFCRRA